MSNDLQALLGLAQQAASQGQNPWTAIRTTFYESVRPTYPGYFVNQIYALSALIAAASLLLGLCMVVKMRQGTYWLVRVHRATGGSFIVLHYANTYSTLFFLFYAVLQGYIWQTERYTTAQWAPNNDIWRMVVWIPGWLAFWLAAWSLAVSHILHLDSSGRPARTFLAEAWFVNAIGLAVPAGTIAAVAILSWRAHHFYSAALDNYSTLDSALAGLENSYNGTFNPYAFAGQGAELYKHFEDNLETFGLFFRWVFIAYLIASMTLFFVLVATATLHLRELRKTMDELTHRAHQSEEAREQEAVIKRGYDGLVQVTYSIIAAAVAINVLFTFVCAAGRKVIFERKFAEVASLLPLWLFAVLGLPLSLLYLRRLISNPPPKSNAREPGTDSRVHAVPLKTHESFSNPSTYAEHKAPELVEAHPMEVMSPVAYHQQHAAPQSEEDYSARNSQSPAPSQASVSPLVEAPFSTVTGQPLYYEARQSQVHSPDATLVSSPSRKKAWM
ncbi:hypothetical protein Rt10032_c09g3936 [Rhodotorula toruloides]|uniref:Uncharacterized protein n=1 Tax=Rhodotorula toruloides TaxID=5286 RepID=A0A511KHR2_RHOTO|nr:hypothetical protein Rt10032_c09g3936 [Rhodotorula toruloides]